MNQKLEVLSKKYYEILFLDKEYQEKFELVNDKGYSEVEMMKRKFVSENFKWRKLTQGKSQENIKNIFYNGNPSELGQLLAIADFYYDEVQEMKENEEKECEKYKLANKIKLKTHRMFSEYFNLKKI